MRALRPYHLVLLLMASLAIFFSKINKRGFYHHYFRVIEEGESRNSQEVLPVGKALETRSPAWWSAERLFPVLRSLFALWVALPLLWIPSLQPLNFGPFLPRPQLQRCHLRTHPARAP
jgi:hypothetical protein